MTLENNNIIKVLIIDDDEDDYFLTSRLLKKITRTQFETDWANNFDDAVIEMGKNIHDVYLVDYRLGEYTGLEIIEKFQKEKITAPCILFTGQDSHELDMEAMEAGFTDYMVKGELTPSLLERTIRYGIRHRESELKIQQLAYYDPLTKLPNRLLLKDRLAVGISRARRRNMQGAILFIDLDNFKDINDSLGHSVGDEMLIKVAGLLKDKLRAEDTVARLGGDEFVIVLTELPCDDDEAQVAASVIAQKFIDIFQSPIELNDRRFHITVSIGVSLFPSISDDFDELYKFADVALYDAKGAGKNTVRFFKPEMEKAARERLDIENDMRQATKDKSFELYYQPQIRMIDKKLCGAEALIRWENGDAGFIPPDKFIPIAEQNHLILEIGEWVLRTACEKLASWPDLPTLSVNISAKQIGQNGFVALVKEIVESSGVDPTRLDLELTETAIFADENLIKDKMNRLKEIGISFSLDDFGTGYSSLIYLRSLPFDTVKIDRSFIVDMLINKDDAAITGATINLAKALNLNIVAEGIETIEHHDKLNEMGCPMAQGYLYSRPLPEAEFIKLLASESFVKAKYG